MANGRNDEIHVLICDDDIEQADILKGALEKAWKKSGAPKRFFAETFHEIVSAAADGPGLKLEELSRFDLVLMDVMWTRGEPLPDEARGIDYCEQIRAHYPELPIIIFSAHVKISDYDRLAALRVDSVVSKKDYELQTLVVNIRSVLERNSVDARGRPLFMQLRATTGLLDAWQPDVLNGAASEFWSHDTAYGKWSGFWEKWDALLARKRLLLMFKALRNQFRDTDLLNLGIMPGMRGHLEHVVFVYFTGYVLSNKIAGFRDAVQGAMKNLLGNEYDPDRAPEYWEAFQFAWLACATLHDTAYCLEVVPDGIKRLKDITARSGIVNFDHELEIVNSKGLKPDAARLPAVWDELSETFSALHGVKRAKWIEDHLEYASDKGGKRFNHGVLGAVQLLLELQNEQSSSDRFSGTLAVGMRWAAVAMSLHSLKSPGSKQGVKLSYQKDPLSFLLMVCDEIQVWNRERPDLVLGESPFRTCELTQLDCTDDSIHAVVTFMHSKKFTGNPDETIGQLRDRIAKDERQLVAYLEPSPLKVKIEFRSAGSKEELGTIKIG